MNFIEKISSPCDDSLFVVQQSDYEIILYDLNTLLFNTVCNFTIYRIFSSVWFGKQKHLYEFI